ncbi:hypothetical protein AB0L59_11375 [Streptomyces sp. NPDC052109]|uniref:hypothetical protein n=1 Tax=Streptomyces sp. NPDC052109 TaxID=3155527 RepID=UPI00343DB436
MREVLAPTDIVRIPPPPMALRLDDDVAQLSAAARGLLPMVLLDLVTQKDAFDPAPALELVEERLSLLEAQEALRPALALGETGRKGGAVAEAQTYLASIQGRLDGVARHISESPELVEFFEEVRAAQRALPGLGRRGRHPD